MLDGAKAKRHNGAGEWAEITPAGELLAAAAEISNALRHLRAFEELAGASKRIGTGPRTAGMVKPGTRAARQLDRAYRMEMLELIRAALEADATIEANRPRNVLERAAGYSR